jgi:diguanylate cyclase (GGDEF)-like protein
MSRVNSSGRCARELGAGRAAAWLSWLSVALLPISPTAMAAERTAPVLTLPAEHSDIESLTTHIELLEDTTRDLSIAEVMDEPHRSAFVAATPATANVGFTDSVWWARFTVRSSGETGHRVFLRQTYPLIDLLDLFEQTATGEWQQHATGDRRPFASREVAHRDFIFPLTIPAQSERTFYLRYESQGPIDISLALYDAPELLASVSKEQIAFGIYFGCVLMLLVWSGLVFVAVRDPAFFAYFAYVATFGLYMLVNNGIAFQFLWPESPRWANTSLIVLLNLAVFAALQFSRVILRAKDYTPTLDRVAQAMQLIFVVSLLVTPLLAYAQIIVPLTMLIMASVIFMLILGTVSMISGSRPARFYLLAWGFFLAGSIVFLLKTFGVLPHTFFTQNGWQIGALFEMVLLSMTLSSRMNELKHQNRTDSLTLLGNRRLFDDKLPTEFALARHLHRPLSLLMLDIDHFKAYNDRHGHAQGDEAIKVVANALRKHARKPFTACRYGGEEFTVILPGVEQEGAASIAERLRLTVQEAMSGDLAITISVGYACMSQTRFESEDKLFEAADFALYSAKQQGRNRTVASTGRRRGDVVDTVEGEKHVADGNG